MYENNSNDSAMDIIAQVAGEMNAELGEMMGTIFESVKISL